MRFLLIILIGSLSTSCSTIKKQKLYSAITGAVIGGALGTVIGKELSPNKDSDRTNKLAGATSGVLIGGYLGTRVGEMFWYDNPEHRPQPDMIIDENLKNSMGSTRTEMRPIKIISPKNVKKVKLQGKIPSFLEGKVKTGHVYIYDIDEYEEVIEEENRIIYHEPHKAYEYTIE